MLHRRKVGMTSSPHGPYVQGYTRAILAGTGCREVARRCLFQKTGYSSDSSLQQDRMKSESLVIADKQAAMNTLPRLVQTARQTMGVSCSISGCANPKGRQVNKEWLVTGVKS